MTQTMVGVTAVAWLHVREGRLLGVRPRGCQRFCLPGGRAEVGETDEQALVREVGTELSLELSDVRPAFTVFPPAHSPLVETSVTLRCFSATAIGEPRPTRGLEEVAWLHIPVDVRAAPAVHAVLARLNR